MGGRDSDDHAIQYVHSFPSPESGLFLSDVSSFFFVPALISFLNNTPFTMLYSFFKVFYNSGFTRTLCGSKWESLSGTSSAFNDKGSSTARLGCCLHGTFMAHPNENPFAQATSCASCPVGNYSGMSDDLNCPYTATTCPGTNAYAVEPASCRVPIPDCTYAVHADPHTYAVDNDRNCGIRQAVDAYITSGSTGSFGPIEDWNTSLVTDMSRVFQSKSTFNANISAWQVGEVTDMEQSTYTLSPPSPRSGLFWLLFFPFFFWVSTNSFFEQCSLLFFFPTHFVTWTFLCCCGAVFWGAGAFNGDLSTWQVGKVTNMQGSTSTLLPLHFKDRVFFRLSLFPFFFLWQH